MEQILTEPNPILRKRAKEVDLSGIDSPEIKLTIKRLKETLAKSRDGIGIAAPQIGISQRIFVVSEEAKFVESEPRESREKKEWKLRALINPAILKSSKKKIDGPEGCLSVPGKFGIVARPEKITLKAVDETGGSVTFGASKFWARVLQHELDHLDGVLFIDKVKRFINVTADEEETL